MKQVAKGAAVRSFPPISWHPADGQGCCCSFKECLQSTATRRSPCIVSPVYHDKHPHYVSICISLSQCAAEIAHRRVLLRLHGRTMALERSTTYVWQAQSLCLTRSSSLLPELVPRRVEFDVEALKKIATKAVDAKKCTRMIKTHEGTFVLTIFVYDLLSLARSLRILQQDFSA